MNKITERNLARKNKDWETSDRLKEELENLGYRMIDGKNGSTYFKSRKEKIYFKSIKEFLDRYKNWSLLGVMWLIKTHIKCRYYTYQSNRLRIKL